MAYMTYFLIPIIFCIICPQYGGHSQKTLDDFAMLLRTIFDEDDDPKGISSDNKSNLDSLLEIQSEELR